MQTERATNEEIFLTSNTRLATALLFLGYTLNRPPCTRQVSKTGRQTVTFIFQPTSAACPVPCGKTAAEWIGIESHDPGSDSETALRARLAWLPTLTGSNVALAYAVLAWREIALDIVKGTPRMVEITEGGSRAFIREDATPADHRALSKYL
jgi:hypothetical protein